MSSETAQPMPFDFNSIDRVQVRELLKVLQRPDQLENNALAQALSPILLRTYPELEARPFAAALSDGIERLWRERAGSFELSAQTQRQLVRFLTLEVWYLYPACHTPRHRLSWRDDKRIGPPETTAEVLDRLNEIDYLAMILANGDLECAKAIFAAHEDELVQSVPPVSQIKGVNQVKTLNSRRDVGTDKLVAIFKTLFREEKTLSMVAAEQAARRRELVAAPNLAVEPGLAEERLPAHEPGSVLPTAGETIIKMDVAGLETTGDGKPLGSVSAQPPAGLVSFSEADEPEFAESPAANPTDAVFEVTPQSALPAESAHPEMSPDEAAAMNAPADASAPLEIRAQPAGTALERAADALPLRPRLATGLEADLNETDAADLTSGVIPETVSVAAEPCDEDAGARPPIDLGCSPDMSDSGLAEAPAFPVIDEASEEPAVIDPGTAQVEPSSTAVDALAVEVLAAPLVELAGSSDAGEPDSAKPSVADAGGDSLDRVADLAASNGVDDVKPIPETANETPEPKHLRAVEPISVSSAVTPSEPGGALAPAELDGLIFKAGEDHRWLWFQVRRLVQQTFAPADIPSHAQLVGRVLSAVTLGLIPNLVTRRLSPEAVAWVCSQCGLYSLQEQQAVVESLKRAQVIRTVDAMVVFAHPLLADWLAAEYIAEYAPDHMLSLPINTRIQRWVVENIIAAGDTHLACRLSLGIMRDVSKRHPVSQLDAAALLMPLRLAVPEPTLQVHWEKLVDQLQSLAHVPSGRVQAMLREYQVPLPVNLAMPDGDADSVIPTEELQAVRAATDIDLLLAALNVRRCDLRAREWYDDDRVTSALVQMLQAGSNWNRRVECAAWLQPAALEKVLTPGWRRFLPGGDVWALAEVGRLAVGRDVPAPTQLLARSVLAAPHHTLAMLNGGWPYMHPLIFTLMLASGLRCERNLEENRWEPLIQSQA